MILFYLHCASVVTDGLLILHHYVSSYCDIFYKITKTSGGVIIYLLFSYATVYIQIIFNYQLYGPGYNWCQKNLFFTYSFKDINYF